MSASSNGFRLRDARSAAARSAGRGDGVFGPNMTPMVDIVLVILVFFMAATAMVGEEWFLRSGIELKQEDQGETGPDAFELPPVRLEIVLDANVTGTLASGLGLERMPLEIVLPRLRAFTEGTALDQIEVMIRPGPAVPYGDVVRVHEACADVGIEKIGLGRR